MELGLLIVMLFGGAALSFGLMGDGDEGTSEDAEAPPQNETVGLSIEVNDELRYVQGKGGDDTISGGETSTVYGVEGLHGDDIITSVGNMYQAHAGWGDDTVDMSAALNGTTIVGGDGEDTLTGSAQGDYIYADGGNSQLDSSYGVGQYHDDGQADVIDGMAGSDNLFFGSGDQASGGEGVDTFNITNLNTIYDMDMHARILDWEAGEGIRVYGDDETATFEVEDRGDDAVVLWQDRVVLTVEGAAGQIAADDVAYSQANSGYYYTDYYAFEVGTTGDDSLDDEASEAIYGDIVMGYEGNDTITMNVAGTGDYYDHNYAFAGDGDDVLTFEGESDNNDDVDYYDDNYAIGGDGADTLNGSDEDDYLYSHGGHGLMDYQQQSYQPNLFRNDGDADVLDGGAGNDNIFISAFDTATGGEGRDVFHVDADGALDEGSPAIITDWEELEYVDLQYSGSDTPTVVNEGGDAVVYLDGNAVLIARGAGGVLTDSDFGAAT